MALTKIRTSGITADAVDNTILDLADDFAFTGTISGTPANTPYFYGRKGSAQSITRNVTTKITGFTTDELDTNSAFDGTTFTVPSGKAGRYYFHACVHSDYTAIGSDGERNLLYLYKNGSTLNIYHDFFINSGYNLAQVTNAYSTIVDLNAADYIELFIYNKDGNASGNAKVGSGSHFFGYRLV